MTTVDSGLAIDGLSVSAYRVPTQTSESDGTADWSHTTLVLVEARAGGRRGLGLTYADRATAVFVEDHLLPVVRGLDAMDIPAAWTLMCRRIRNQGRPGVASTALSAVDNALWDLKARLLNVPLARLLGRAQDGVAVYGSGGFTSYTLAQLERHVRHFADLGLTMVKIKVGEHPLEDLTRVEAARRAAGPDIALFVDANGAFDRKQALLFARRFADLGVSWFEEPVSSDDLEGLRFLRDAGPAGLSIAAGEYGYDLPYFRRMLDVGAVDVLQADVTRCGGISGFLEVAALCKARSLPLSGHTSPAQHLAVAAALSGVVHVEYFFDHVRIEQMLFEGTPTPRAGRLFPDLSVPGNGLELKRTDAERYKVHEGGL